MYCGMNSDDVIIIQCFNNLNSSGRSYFRFVLFLKVVKNGKGEFIQIVCFNIFFVYFLEFSFFVLYKVGI